jgi:hypothetical protein
LRAVCFLGWVCGGGACVGARACGALLAEITCCRRSRLGTPARRTLVRPAGCSCWRGGWCRRGKAFFFVSLGRPLLALQPHGASRRHHEATSRAGVAPQGPPRPCGGPHAGASRRSEGPPRCASLGAARGHVPARRLLWRGGRWAAAAALWRSWRRRHASRAATLPVLVRRHGRGTGQTERSRRQRRRQRRSTRRQRVPPAGRGVGMPLRLYH